MTAPRARTVLAVVIAGTAFAAAPALAQAATVDLSGGSTTLTLDGKTASALTHLGVQVGVSGKAKAKGRTVTFPITGGAIDPATAAGTIRHTGGLTLRAGKTKVTLSDFTVTVAKRPTMTAKVNGGGRAALLLPVLGKAKVSPGAVETDVTGVAVHLTSKGAKALNTAFHVTAFTPKLKLGTATISARLKEIAFAGGQTDLTLDPGAASALTSLGVTPGVVGPATANADGSLGFPITGGTVDAKTLAGTITHSGGIALTKGATTVTLTDFTIDTKAGQLTAVVAGGARAAILTLDLSKPAVTVKGRSVTVGNVSATLTQGAADALNGAFGTSAFTAGLTLGVATVRGES